MLDSGTGLGLPFGIELAPGEHARLEVGDVAHLLAVEVVGLQAAHLKDELGVAEIHDGNLGVGRLSLVVIAEATAQTQNGLGEGGARAVLACTRCRDQPASLVHLVDALVPDVAIAEIPEPVPVVMNQVGVKSLLGCRPEPDVVGELCRGITRGLDPDATAGLVAESPRNLQLAKLAGLDHGDGMSPLTRGPALRAVLDNPIVATSGLDGDAPFVHVVAARFFDVHVLPGLAGPDGDQGVPVIGSGNRDGVDRLVFEHAANVLNGRRLTASILLDLRRADS